MTPLIPQSAHEIREAAGHRLERLLAGLRQGQAEFRRAPKGLNQAQQQLGGQLLTQNVEAAEALAVSLSQPIASNRDKTSKPE